MFRSHSGLDHLIYKVACYHSCLLFCKRGGHRGGALQGKGPPDRFSLIGMHAIPQPPLLYLGEAVCPGNGATTETGNQEASVTTTTTTEGQCKPPHLPPPLTWGFPAPSAGLALQADSRREKQTVPLLEAVTPNPSAAEDGALMW